jgi:hypothetical protein
MKILSIDVGIKNLAFCLFEKKTETEEFTVTQWDIVNLSSENNFVCIFVENNKACNKPAKFKKNNQCYCLKHSKKINKSQIPGLEEKPSFINKQKIQTLYAIAETHKIEYDSKIKKKDLAKVINDYIKEQYFETIENKNASIIDLFSVGLNMKTHLNKLFEKEEKIDYVIIENQISPIATRMKTIQGMLVQYFIMSSIQVEHIDFVSAANKLKDCDISKKTKYSDRKKIGIEKCSNIILNDNRFNEQIDYFTQHKKKDDLADSFLQGLWFIKTNLEK